MKHTPGPWRACGCSVYQQEKWENGNVFGTFEEACQEVEALQ